MSELLLIKRQEHQLTKEQQTFNKLIRSLEKNKKLLAELEERFQKYTTTFSTAIAPEQAGLQEACYKLAQLFDRHYETGKLNKGQREKTAHMILNLLSNIDSPSYGPETTRLAEKYEVVLSEGASEEEEKMDKALLKEMIFFQTGIKLEDDELDLDNTDAVMEKLRERMQQEKAEQAKTHFSDTKHKSYQGKSKKLKEKAELLKKSWKTLYNKLVKKLHPDAEQDEQQKLRKTDLMQQVTAAYEKNDFYQLLALYQQEIGFEHMDETQSHDNNALANSYIPILKKQNQELAQKIELLKWQAASQGIHFLARRNADKSFEQHLRLNIRKIRNDIEETEQDLAAFTELKAFKQMLANTTVSSLTGEDDFFLFDNDADDYKDYSEEFFGPQTPRKKKKKE